MYALKNVKKDEILSDVTIQFREKELVYIIETSGEGKTTLFHMMSGIEPCSEGSITYQGQLLNEFLENNQNSEKRLIGCVFQGGSILPYQTLLGQVELSGEFSGIQEAERNEKAILALTKAGVDSRWKDKPARVPADIMERASIASALIGNPRILLVDAPLNGLTSGEGEGIMELLAEEARHRLVIVFISDLELSDRFPARKIRLQGGMIADDSRPFNKTVISPIPMNGTKSKGSVRRMFLLSVDYLKGKPEKFVVELLISMAGMLGIGMAIFQSNLFLAVPMVSYILFAAATVKSVKSRRKEFRILRSLGVFPKEIRWLLVMHNIYIGLFSSLCALAVFFLKHLVWQGIVIALGHMIITIVIGLLVIKKTTT